MDQYRKMRKSEEKGKRTTATSLQDIRIKSNCGDNKKKTASTATKRKNKGIYMAQKDNWDKFTEN